MEPIEPGTAFTDGHRAVKAAGLVVSLLLVLLSAGALLGPSTVASAAPVVVATPPVVARPTVVGGSGSAILTWTATPGSAGPILSYVVSAHNQINPDDVAYKTVSADDAGPPSAAEFTYTGLRNNTRYFFTVTAVDADGPGDPSPESDSVLLTAAWPYGNSVYCVRALYADLLGVSDPSAARVKNWSDRIDHYGNTCAWVAQQFWLSSGFQTVVPSVTRLYQAYFLRIPDFSGHAYWVGKRRSGQSLAGISAFFASGPEFRARYGSLDNAQFLTQVYRNVFDRSPDASGYRYWLGLLNRGSIGRGSVMLLFSESDEYVSTQDPRIKAEMVYLSLLRRAPSEPELEASAGRLPNADAEHQDLEETDLLIEISWIMRTSEYRARVLALMAGA